MRKTDGTGGTQDNCFEEIIKTIDDIGNNKNYQYHFIISGNYFTEQKLEYNIVSYLLSE